ncbi:ribbon-helix-helix domain-containing protein [Acidiphilium sp.]|uniref:ribbon-helix-helix domain-containing protein n=1 Tax=Acidiphilium TaxID=522 RepID=UPI00338DD8AE
MKHKICISVDPPLLDQVDQFAAQRHASRSWAITTLARTALDHAPISNHEPRRPIVGDQPRGNPHE